MISRTQAHRADEQQHTWPITIGPAPKIMMLFKSVRLATRWEPVSHARNVPSVGDSGVATALTRNAARPVEKVLMAERLGVSTGLRVNPCDCTKEVLLDPSRDVAPRDTMALVVIIEIIWQILLRMRVFDGWKARVRGGEGFLMSVVRNAWSYIS